MSLPTKPASPLQGQVPRRKKTSGMSPVKRQIESFVTLLERKRGGLTSQVPLLIATPPDLTRAELTVTSQSTAGGLTQNKDLVDSGLLTR